MRTYLTIVLSVLMGSALYAQAPSTAPAAGGAATQPATEPMSARVIQLAGAASYALANPDGNTSTWNPLKVGDVLPAGARVRTQLRARVVLAFGDDTVVVIERATLASIDQFHRSADTKRVRLGLGHGTIRAGVAETTLRSDMTIETPTATLSKRGTMDFGISYEPSNRRFRIFLDKDGLVEAMKHTTNESRFVRPGQYVTEAMERWINSLSNERWIPVVDTYGLTDAETVFNRLNNSGLATLNPGAGGNILTISSRDFAGVVNGNQGPALNTTPLVTPSNGSGPIARPEGNFGTGGGALSVAFKNAHSAR